jgi:hypothetical protein
VARSFEAEVERGFGPLLTGLGLSETLEPARVPGVQCVAYRSPRLTYRVCLSLEDHAVSTAVHLAGEEETLVSYLEEVVPATGLGSRQSVPTSAHTLHGMQGSLSAQAEWVRRLHPVIAGPGGAELLRRAGARRWLST